MLLRQLPLKSCFGRKQNFLPCVPFIAYHSASMVAPCVLNEKHRLPEHVASTVAWCVVSIKTNLNYALIKFAKQTMRCEENQTKEKPRKQKCGKIIKLLPPKSWK